VETIPLHKLLYLSLQRNATLRMCRVLQIKSLGKLKLIATSGHIAGLSSFH
jgi:hypothetical protein